MASKRPTLTEVVSSPLFVLAGFLATILALTDPVLKAFRDKDFIGLALYLLFFGFLLFLVYFISRRQARIQPLTRKYFKPFEKLESQDVWPRRDEKEQLIETIKKPARRPVILVGDSGVGKSVIVASELIPALKEEGWKIAALSNYDHFKVQIREHLVHIFPKSRIRENGGLEGIERSDAHVLLIFDQFEEFLSSNSRNVPDQKQSREWFRQLLISATKVDNMSCLIVIRKEWYYDLRFLAEFVPPPIESFHLSGLKMGGGEDTIPTLLKKITTAAKNSEVGDTVLQSLAINGEILPVEAQIVGCMLENEVRAMGEINRECYLKELGGKDGLIKKFLQASLDSSPDRGISLQVLFALSLETRFRNQLSLPQIVDIVHKPKDEVLDCLTFLVVQRLIHETRAGYYQLTHDYLAERFHELSGSELGPAERDNILFFGDEIRKEKGLLDITRLHSRGKLFSVFSDYPMIFLAILLVARLTGPLYNMRWGWFNFLDGYEGGQSLIDAYYLPVFVTHFAWAIYVTLFYRRFFSLLKEGIFARILSILTVITCTVVISLAAFVPYCWIFSVGIGGLAIGAKLYQLSKSRGLSTISKSFFSDAGIRTLCNAAFVSVLGGSVVYNVVTQPPSLSLVQQLNQISIFLAIFLTYAMLIMRQLHVTKKASSIMLGMFDRSSQRLRPLKTDISKVELEH